MNRLAARLVLSHVLVAVLGGLATFLVVRTLTPALFDQMMGGQGPMMGQRNGGSLRGQVADAVTQALVIGVLVGIAAATVFGIFAAQRLVRPLRQLGDTTREIAAGHYDVHVDRPHEHELALLADDVNTLGRTLAETESRRVRLLGELAHEMRTPLTVIEGSVEGMIDGVLPAGPERLGLVSDEVRRLRRLSDDLSALSRTEEGRLGLRSRAGRPARRGHGSRRAAAPAGRRRRRRAARQDAGSPRARGGRRRPVRAGGDQPRRQRPAGHGCRRADRRRGHDRWGARRRSR